MANDSPVDLIATDPESIYTATLETLENGVNEPLYPGDERRIFGEALAYVLSTLHLVIQDAARQTMLQYARGEVLDALGARLGVTRLDGNPAVTTVRFISATPDAEVSIPKGTRVTPDGVLYFATTESATIGIGETYADVPCECMTAGEVGNGYGAGSIATLVDLIPYISGAANITETADGDDGEAYTETGDDRFRERIMLAPSTLSTAGPAKGYEYWAKSADSRIIDASVMSETEWVTETVPVRAGHAHVGGDLIELETLSVDGEQSGYMTEYADGLLDITLLDARVDAESVSVRYRQRMDGRVRIVVLLADGEETDTETLRRVYEAVNDSEVRPITDLVTVVAPDPVEYTIALEYWTTPQSEAAAIEGIEGDGGAIEQYVTQQGSKLGRDINPSVLESLVMAPGEGMTGAVRCVITQPEHAAVTLNQVARWDGEVNVTHHVITDARWS